MRRASQLGAGGCGWWCGIDHQHAACPNSSFRYAILGFQMCAVPLFLFPSMSHFSIVVSPCIYVVVLFSICPVVTVDFC